MRRPTFNIPAQEAAEEPPPILGSWRRLYAAVVAYLVAVIVLAYFFTRTLNQ